MVSRRFSQGLFDRLRIAGNDGQIRAYWTIRLGPALFPLLYGSGIESILRGELALGQPELLPDGLHVNGVWNHNGCGSQLEFSAMVGNGFLQPFDDSEPDFRVPSLLRFHLSLPYSLSALPLALP